MTAADTVLRHDDAPYPDAFTRAEVGWTPHLAPLAEEDLTPRHLEGLVDAARAKNEYFRLLARDPHARRRGGGRVLGGGGGVGGHAFSCSTGVPAGSAGAGAGVVRPGVPGATSPARCPRISRATWAGVRASVTTCSVETRS